MNATIYFRKFPAILSTATIAGPKESEGPLGRFIERRLSDDTCGEKTYEKAECKMLTYAIEHSIKNGGLHFDDIGMIVSGDLLNQIISSSFSARQFDIPFLGIYNACSTMSEGLAIAAAFVNGGYFDNIVIRSNSVAFVRRKHSGRSPGLAERSFPRLRGSARGSPAQPSAE